MTVLASFLLALSAPLSPQAEFGDGCLGASGIEPRLEFRSDVKPGLPIRADLFGAPGTAGLLIAGSSADQWGALPLPLALGDLEPLFGVCTLNVSPDLVLPISLDAFGQAELEFQGWMEGAEVFLQFWNQDVGVVPVATLGGFSPGYRAESEPVGSVLFPSVPLLPDVNSQGVAWGDFNGDGLVDLLETASPNQAYLRFGLGGGEFSIQPALTLASGSSSPRVGDFNNDGLLDFAVVFSNFGARVHLGDGTGGFTPKFTVDLGGQFLTAIQYPDLNGDGVLDVVGASAAPPRLAYALGNGDGNFGVPQFIDLGGATQQLLTAQVDGQGWLDLVLLSDGAPQVTVLVEGGSGTFEGPIAVDALGNDVEHLAVADLDGDGDDELILSGPGGGATLVASDPASGVAMVLPGELGGEPQIGDLNNDGELDLVLVRQNDHRILLGAGGGALAPAGPVQQPGGETVFLEDLNADGWLDLLVGAAEVALGNGEGGFGTPALYPTTFNAPVFGLVDLDGEGTPDLLARDPFFRLSWMRNEGDGAFSWFQDVDDLPLLSEVLDLDVNGDGAQDVVYLPAFGDELVLRLGGPEGLSAPQLFETPKSNPFQFPQIFAIDADGDPYDDVLVLSVGVFGGASSFLHLADPSGNGELLPAVSGALAGVSSFLGSSTAQIDGDAFEDLVFWSEGSLTLFAGDGQGSWTALPSHSTGLSNSALKAGFDFTGDGVTDLILWDQNVDRTFVQPGLGGGTFGSTLDPVGTEVFPGHIADVDLDGDLDLISASGSDAWVALNDGAGSFGATIVTAGLSPLTQLVVADVNLDGLPDFVARTDPIFQDDEITVGLGIGDGTFALQPPIFTPTENELSPRTHLLADFTGDGAVDLLIGDSLKALVRNALLY